MKKTKLSLLTVSLIALLITSIFGCFSFKKAEKTEKRELISNILIQSLNTFHFQPTSIDDEFSKKLFEQYLNNVDYSKRILLQSDVEKLRTYETKLDDEIYGHSFQFFDVSHDILEERMKNIETIYSKFLSKPIKLDSKTIIELDPEKINRPENKAEQEKIWQDFLTYEVIAKIYNLDQDQIKNKEKNDTIKLKSISELEVEAREKVKKNYDDWFKRLSKLDKKDRFSTYINTITSIYDPHTSFFPPKDKENFDIRLSGKLEGIGATLQEKDGYIKVIRIVPGSASWRQGELQIGDIILKVAQGNEEPVNIVDMRLDEAVELIRGPKESEVQLTVRKIDGEEKIISIIRDVVIIEETYAKSAVIVDSLSGKKLGLINLPSFYADFSDEDGRNCADDVLKEIIKLKTENVDGIAIDLRDNGGGSLRDVVTIGGYFIKEGPIVQIKNKIGKATVLPDMDPAVQYNGPLVIMVNELSASASEILAAAMQDYNRAIVIGSSQTYGKGTVQRIIDLDQLVDVQSDMKPLGAAKITIQKFYRINGATTQKEGVNSDVVLPDAYEYLNYGEKELENVLEWDVIESAAYERLNQNDFSKIIASSKQRVENNPVFNQIDANAKRLKYNQDFTNYPLDYVAYKTLRDKEKEEADKYKDLLPTIDEMQIQWTKHDSSIMEADTNKRSSFVDWSKNLKKDPYIFEALKIIESF